jgi:hypothetical protein
MSPLETVVVEFASMRAMRINVTTPFLDTDQTFLDTDQTLMSIKTKCLHLK